MKLIVQDIEKAFGEKKVLQKACASFESGKIYGLLGRNGAGKTTLFRMIYDDLEKDGGEVLLEEEGRSKSLEHKEVGMVFSQPVLPNFLTGYEFIRFFSDVHGGIKGESIEDSFQRFGFDDGDMNRLIIGYSHGMKSKLHLMCMAIAKPKIILLDEPLTSLDVVIAAEMKKMLLELKEDRILIISTHILQLAKDLCDEIVLLKDGKLQELTNLTKDNPDYEEEVIRALTEEEDV